MFYSAAMELISGSFAVAHCVGLPIAGRVPRARGLALGYMLSPTAWARHVLPYGINLWFTIKDLDT